MSSYPFKGGMHCTSDIGQRDVYPFNHEGIDLIPTGGDSTIYAITSGTVSYAASYGAYGLHCKVKNDDGTLMTYAHLSSMYVKKDQYVNEREPIGIMGSTGNSTGAHLHLTIQSTHNPSNWNSDLINPGIYLGLGTNPAGQSFTGDYTQYPTIDTIVPQTGAAAGTAGYLDTVIPDTYYKVTGVGSASGDILFGRKYKIIVASQGGSGVDVSNLRCTFEITKTAYLTPNTSTVTIYNLSPETEAKIMNNAYTVIIEAGYERSRYGIIFTGNVVQTIRGKENGTDYFLTLVCMDGDRFMTYGNISNSFVANQTMRSIAEKCLNTSINAASIAIGQLGIEPTIYPRGKVLFGLAKNYLQTIADSTNRTFYIEDGKAYIVGFDELPQNEVISLNPSTGLIGTPQQTETGVNCVSLLLPTLKIGSLIHLDNITVQGMQYDISSMPTSSYRPLDSEGLYRIIKLTFEGDTRGNPWYANMECVSQSGALPSMINTNSQYAW